MERLQKSKTMPEVPRQPFDPEANGISKRKSADEDAETPMSMSEKKKTDLTGTTRKETDDEPKLKEGKWKRFYRKMFLDDPIPIGQQLRTILFPQWYTINWLLLAVPVGIALHFKHVNPLAVFIVNFVAIVPLAAMLGMATEEIALRVGEVLGGLLNASFG